MKRSSAFNLSVEPSGRFFFFLLLFKCSLEVVPARLPARPPACFPALLLAQREVAGSKPGVYPSSPLISPTAHLSSANLLHKLERLLSQHRPVSS